MAKTQVIIYTRPGCHLCEEAKEAIYAAECSDHFRLEEINIETEPALLQRYGDDIPVVMIDGIEAFRHRVNAKEFKARVLAPGSAGILPA